MEGAAVLKEETAALAALAALAAAVAALGDSEM